MVSPSSNDNESYIKTARVFVKTDFKTLYYSLLKLKFTPSVVKHKKD